MTATNPSRTSAAAPSATPDPDCCAVAEPALMDPGSAEELADVFKALADPTRVRLLAYVAAAHDGTVCACHLPGELGISQPTLSHHLKKLVAAGLLEREQRGRWAHYRVEPSTLAAACEFLSGSRGIAHPANPASRA